ncbi:MAG: A49-like RNA polymerase I associated factor-domain-containing protein [Monoraphidium minutum]|nr:MAG: A49-like RNA polymerase I associated factor-domain-containing protein [Monoraphidium minutum]
MGKRQRQEEQEQAAAKRKESSSSSSSESGSGTSSSGGGSDSDTSGGTAAAAPAANAKRAAVPISVVRGGAPGAAPPFVAYFANGRVPAYANGGGAAAPGGKRAEPWRFQVYEGRGPDPQRMLVSEQGNATLIGRPSDPELREPGCNYVLGIFDKEARTLQLVCAEGGQITRVEAHVNGANYGLVAGAARPDADAAAERDADIKARRAAATRLVEQFGSTRRRRQLKSREEGTVRADKLLSGEAAEAALAAVNRRAAEEGGTRLEVLSRVAAARNIPPHDLTATEPRRAYPLREMVPEAVLSNVNVGQLLHAADKPAVLASVTEKKLVPEYVLSRLPLLRSAADEKARKGKARVMALLAALLQLAGPQGGTLRVPAGGLDDLARSTRVGRREVLEGLLELFYHKSAGEDGGERWVRDAAKRELMTGYALVLALDAEGWAMAGPQFEALAAQLRMSLQDLAQRFRELGCVVAPVKGPDYTDGKSYTSTLLQQPSRGAATLKSLADCLPKPKGPPKARGR